MTTGIRHRETLSIDQQPTLTSAASHLARQFDGTSCDELACSGGSEPDDSINAAAVASVAR